MRQLFGQDQDGAQDCLFGLVISNWRYLGFVAHQLSLYQLPLDRPKRPNPRIFIAFKLIVKAIHVVSYQDTTKVKKIY